MTVVKLENDYDEDKENVDKNDIDACNHINCRLPRKKKISWVNINYTNMRLSVFLHVNELMRTDH